MLFPEIETDSVGQFMYHCLGRKSKMKGFLHYKHLTQTLGETKADLGDKIFFPQIFLKIKKKKFLIMFRKSCHGIPYKFYVLGQIGLSKQCRPRSDCF